MRFHTHIAFLFLASVLSCIQLCAQLPKTISIDPIEEYTEVSYRNTASFVSQYHARKLYKTYYSFYVNGKDTTMNDRGITLLGTYDSSGRMITDSGYFVTSYIYNGDGLLIKRFNEKKTELFRYDASRRMIEYELQHDHRLGTRTYYSYDVQGRLHSSESYVYILKSTPSGIVPDSIKLNSTRYEFDNSGRVKLKLNYLYSSSNDTSISKYVYIYSSSGTTIYDSSSTNGESYIRFNEKGMPLETYYPTGGQFKKGIRSVYQYSDKGDLVVIVETTNEQDFPTSYIYDSSGRLSRIVTKKPGYFQEEILNWEF